MARQRRISDVQVVLPCRLTNSLRVAKGENAPFTEILDRETCLSLSQARTNVKVSHLKIPNRDCGFTSYRHLTNKSKSYCGKQFGVVLCSTLDRSSSQRNNNILYFCWEVLF
jgi:hypothetical protein